MRVNCDCGDEQPITVPSLRDMTYKVSGGPLRRNVKVYDPAGKDITASVMGMTITVCKETGFVRGTLEVLIDADELNVKIA